MTDESTDTAEPSAGGRDGLAQKAAAQLQRAARGVVHQGVGPLTGSVPYAEARLSRHGDADRAIKVIIRESTLAAGTQGFVTSVGGLVTLPVSLPASIAGALIVNARMVGAIAHLRGYDLRDPHVEAVLMLVVAGSSPQAAASALGAKIGAEFSKQAIKAVPIAVVRRINERAGFYLLAKYGTKRAAITLAKAVPVVSGLVGGGVDASLTQLIGRRARVMFPAESVVLTDVPTEEPRRADRTI